MERNSISDSKKQHFHKNNNHETDDNAKRDVVVVLLNPEISLFIKLLEHSFKGR